MSSGSSKRKYERELSRGTLSRDAMNKIFSRFEQNHLRLESIPEDLLHHPTRITQKLSRLELRAVKGNSSWEGLAVGFPGSKEDLSTEHISTPYVREILYPILDLYDRLKKRSGARMSCLYLIGPRFSDVLLRKFRLLHTLIPHVIILTDDLLGCVDKPAAQTSKKPESMIQSQLCKTMKSEKGLLIKPSKIRLGYLSHEVPTYEGTLNPERLDILGYDKEEGSIVAFEIKGKCARIELENLFLQGIEHRNWLEENKMAVKFVFGGPRCDRIDTKKRVRLVLGACGEHVPVLFHELKKKVQKDPYLEVDFCSLSEGLTARHF